nr:tetratricopeptide repeat protein [Micromonospora sp. DSM 115978]
MVAAAATWALVADDKSGWTVTAGVIAALLTAFGPSLVEDLRQLYAKRRQRDQALRDAEVASLPKSVAWLLHPTLEVVPFFGRGWDLQSLEHWCIHDTDGPVRLLAAGGGVGKTRLARQLQHRLSNWQTRWVAAGKEREVAELVAHEETDHRLLLVLDYADSRDPEALASLLVAVARATGRVRLLLLARSAGSWWTGLSFSASGQATLVDALTADRSAVMKLAGEVDERPPEDVVTEAIGAFAAHLRRQPPAGYQPRQHDRGTPLLRLHAEALVAVLGAPRDTGRHDVLAEVLSHEVRYWRSSAQRSGVNLPQRPEQSDLLLQRLVGITALLGAADHDELADVLARVPWPQELESYRDQDWSSWLSGLYPATAPDGSGIGTLEPDLLAEHLAVDVLINCTPAQRSAVFGGLRERQARQALTVLGRAHAHRSADVLTLLEPAISTDVPALGGAAIDLARLFPGHFTPILLTLLPRTVLDSDQLRALALKCPYPSRELNPIALHLTGRIVEAQSTSTQPAHRSEWCSWHSIRLAEAGRRADALTWSEEAVTHYRELAATNPDAYLPDLARSVNNHAVRLAEAGRRADALTWSEEAVTLRRELATTNPDAYLHDLAGSVNNHAVMLAEAGRRADALTWSEEAVTHYRELAATNPDAYLPDLARSVNNHAVRLAEAGRRADALTWSEEAVTLRRELATTNPDAYLHDLAASVNNHAVMLAEAGRRADALTWSEEAVTHSRELAATNPDAYLPDLAWSVNNHAVRLAEAGRRTDALTWSEEAVTLRRELATTNPDAYLHDLAGSVNNHAVLLAEAGRRTDALTWSEEAVTHYRELAATNPDAYLPDLARSVNN